MGNRLDALCPESLVELGVEADVGGAHRLLGKVDDGLDGPGSALLEGAAVDALVEVDGVFAGHDILEGGARLAALCMRVESASRVQEERKDEDGMMRMGSCSTTGMKRTFLVVFAEGAWQEVSTENNEKDEKDSDGPCLEDVGVGELELWERHRREQRAGAFGVVCVRWRRQIRFSGLEVLASSSASAGGRSGIVVGARGRSSVIGGAESGRRCLGVGCLACKQPLGWAAGSGRPFHAHPCALPVSAAFVPALALIVCRLRSPRSHRKTRTMHVPRAENGPVQRA